VANFVAVFDACVLTLLQYAIFSCIWHSLIWSRSKSPHSTPICTTKSSRENRVNQYGSVALSTEAMRGPP
jgi:hypothetical protein